MHPESAEASEKFFAGQNLLRPTTCDRPGAPQRAFMRICTDGEVLVCGEACMSGDVFIGAPSRSAFVFSFAFHGA
jgi:hypothetical protein